MILQQGQTDLSTLFLYARDKFMFFYGFYFIKLSSMMTNDWMDVLIEFNCHLAVKRKKEEA